MNEPLVNDLDAVEKDDTVSVAFSEIGSLAALEVAAQLAELNANLRAIFQAEDPNSLTPRLRIDKLD